MTSYIYIYIYIYIYMKSALSFKLCVLADLIFVVQTLCTCR
jgi:hypothetical protein